ncbi:Undecaprenyl-phosphate alpha-N-acetylglucosaminyl 1-phosphate transferase [wastewater metagenome]|uniref:Undecaprenyl-phosphate alpha-N-acetylglucosaminyl 1-phosphate transferase n=2 Tax=unclassified sequences TaxID=12908 RepID=A0A5B8RC16_9ZZZZ|nr:MraY family glycosyltransferase [Arhodomonas sp. KWT]QEA05623.1 undecaprenyl-phosphate alpha-N-acetylglucosaminyl 1-phosphate transferase [uncultured organism]
MSLEPSPLQLLVVAFLALVGASGLIALLRPYARRIGLIDRPGGRKRHAAPVPLIGGIGVFGGFLVAVAAVPGPLASRGALFTAMALLLLGGVLDDIRDMRSTSKLLLQAAAAAVVVASGDQVLRHVGGFPLVGDLVLATWAIPLTLFALVGLINATNMLDGLDGLVGGVVFVMLGWLLFVAGLQEAGAVSLVIVALMGGVAGFLAFNMRLPWRCRASVFLGDAGSMSLGLAVGWIVIELSQAQDSVLSPVAYGWVLALPVVDTVSLMIRRLCKGQSPFAADREHLHHIFLRAGYTPGQTSACLVLIAAAFGAIGVLGGLAGMPDWLLLVGLVAVVVLHYVFIRHAWYTMRALRRLHAGWEGGHGPFGSVGAVRVIMHPPVNGWRRSIALFGIYLAIFCLPFSRAGMNIGLGLVLAATAMALPAFWRDARRLVLTWLMLALTGYIVARALIGGAPVDGTPSWDHLVRVAGLISLPVGWWLAGARAQWVWMLMSLVAGGAVAFVAQANWGKLNAGVLSDPAAWGSASTSGFLGAVILMLLLGGMIAAVHRLGRGWRPVFTLAVCVVLSVPVITVLVGSRYTTGWVGALAGALVIGLGAIAYGVDRRQWLGLAGGVVMFLVVGLGAWEVVITGSGPWRDDLAEPIQAAALYFGGEVEQARALDPSTGRRLQLWQGAAERIAERPVFGWARMSPRQFDGPLSAFREYNTLYGAVAVGFGLVGMALFAAVVVGVLYQFIVLARDRIWPTSWVLAMLGANAAVLVMLGLAIQIDDTSSRTVIVLLMAAGVAAAFQRQWIQRD